MKAIIYSRVSSKEQIEGTSLASQETACYEYARDKGFHVIRVFREEGESAKFADRTQLLQLIDFCRANKGTIERLLVWKVDRFARNVTDHFNVKATLAKYGIHIVSVTEPIDANPEGKLMETILAGFAEFDNSVRTTRTVNGMRRKLQEGISPWHPPLGYKPATGRGEKKNSPDLPHEPAFSLLQKAWREFATGAHAKAEMRRLMQSWGIAKTDGGPLPPQSIDYLFTNRYYEGILVDPWTGEEYPGRHVAMVTADEFAAVQRIISRRSRSVPHQKTHPQFPLRGLVRCDSCRRALTGAVSHGRRNSYPYYRCYRQGCIRRNTGLPAGEIHKEFVTFLRGIAPQPGFIAEIGDRIIRHTAKEKAQVTAQKQARRRQMQLLDKQAAELISMRAQRLITDEEFFAQKQRLRIHISALQRQLDHKDFPARVEADLADIESPLAALADTWESLRTTPFLQRFQQLIFPGGFIVRRIGTADLGLLFKLFRTLARQDAGSVPFPCIRLSQVISEIHELREILAGVDSTR
jgi:DNA invertase Pin-like site-specific DNA recombinase